MNRCKFLSCTLVRCYGSQAVSPNGFGGLGGQKWVKMASKWAQTIGFGIAIAPELLSEKHVSRPFGAPLWSPNGPFSRLFGTFSGSKRATMG